MNAGLLNEPITILTPNIIVNEYGEEVTEWKNKYTTKARVLHDGGQRVENDEIYYEGRKTFQIRYYVPIDFFDRILFQNRQYRVLDLSPNREYNNITIKTELVND